ncbi:MAG: glycosyltransferase family 2 protein [Dehalococcoidales bacterium]|nr:glycosyltransferase family 2 protein [Dehalococcoidales bacterium]
MENSVTIVVPTYNEHDNITPLVEKISKSISRYDYEILFIDDASSDGTAGVIESLKTSYPVRVIVRRDEKGLASAVVKGFENARHDLIVVMDADLQHPPEIIPQLLDAIAGVADVAVGSRYVPGGGCDEWSGLRKLLSRGAILLANMALPKARRVKDPMSGFFALKRKVIEGVRLDPIGYKILLEVLVLGNYNQAAEVPFQFQLREQGKSKLDLNQQYEYLRHLARLSIRSGEFARFMKFCLVGASGVLVNYGLYWILTRFAGFNPISDTSSGVLSGNIALTISIETSIITNFILNNFFTFSDRNVGGFGGFFKRLVHFNLICIIGGLIQIGVANLFAVVFGVNDLIAVLIGIVIAFFWNYLLNNYLTWKK